MEKTVSPKSSDCLSCRIVSFVGLTGSGTYVAYHASKQKGLFGKCTLGAFALGLAYIGTARLTNMYPFTKFNPSDDDGKE